MLVPPLCVSLAARSWPPWASRNVLLYLDCQTFQSRARPGTLNLATRQRAGLHCNRLWKSSDHRTRAFRRHLSHLPSDRKRQSRRYRSNHLGRHPLPPRPRRHPQVLLQRPPGPLAQQPLDSPRQSELLDALWHRRASPRSLRCRQRRFRGAGQAVPGSPVML